VFAEAIRQGTVAELLGKVPVEAGECHFLPAGTAHSIGAGLLIAEIQTPSDTTYRVFDWNRLDDSGKPRQLHIEEALESINFETAGEELPVTTIGRLADCEYFKIDKGHQAAGCELLLSAGTMRTLIMMTGRGRIVGGAPGSVDFKAGDCLLIPAAYEGVTKFVEDTEYLTITI
jgi:mannose-6-phosphate isomerase